MRKRLKMTSSQKLPSTWHRFAIGSALVVAVTLGGSATAGSKRDKDQNTCASMGAPHGSPSYTECMLQQQQRRDQKMSIFLEQQLMHQELGRPAREKLEQKKARRARERDRDRWQDQREWQERR